MNRAIALLFAPIALLATHAAAQRPEEPGPYPAGTRNFIFKNKYAGSPAISCLIAYPAKTSGPNTPIDLRGAPYPVIVFAHGYGMFGNSYASIAKHYASWGFVVVAPNTFRYGPIASLSLDVQAMTHIIRDAHTRTRSFLFGAIDVKNFGVSGHSMGGGATADVLGSSTDVQAAVLLAPWTGGPSQPDASEQMRAARVPFQILVGAGDTTTPPKMASRFYRKGRQARGYRGILTLWSGCNHSAVGGFVRTTNDVEAYRLCRRQMTAFMLAHLKGRHDMLDALVGTATHKEPKFYSLDYAIIDPDLYLTGSPAVGGNLDYHIMAQASTPAITYISPASGSLPLPGLGTLGLQTSSMFYLSNLQTSAIQTLHASLPIPNNSHLANLTLWVQTVAMNPSNAYRLTPTRSFRIAK